MSRIKLKDRIMPYIATMLQILTIMLQNLTIMVKDSFLLKAIKIIIA